MLAYVIPGWSRKQVTAHAQHKGSVSSTRTKAPPFRAPIPADQRSADFRFWHDEKRFRGSGDESLAQHTLLAAGGIRMGGNPKAAPVQGPMGWQVTNSWDILWSTSDGAHKAAPLIKPQTGQLINALPGLESLTRKRNLALTLQAAYGDAAWNFVPRSYSLPSQLVQWRQRLADEAQHLAASATAGSTASAVSSSSDSAQAFAAAASGSDMGQVTGWWALKTGQHLGQGLQVVPSSKALSTMLERNAPHIKQAAAEAAAAATAAAGGGAGAAAAAAAQPSEQLTEAGASADSSSSGEDHDTDSSEDSVSSSGSYGSSGSTAAPGTTDTRNPPRPFISVQQYITQPLLINNRKFGLRVWVLVIGPKPYRAYVYQQGLVLFSSQDYNPDLAAVQAEGAAAQGHLTNAALWGPEKHQHSSPGSEGGNTNRELDSSSSSNDYIPSSSPSNPAQQPVWSLQQLFDVLGQQHAQHVWQQILDTAGKVVAAGARHVADAAQQLKWGGDAAFELLGFDFLLDSSCKPWLLEVNASPSMAWNSPDQLTATQLMYDTKQQMLTDMFALLRLQDRYPPTAGTAADTATAAVAAARASKPWLPADHGMNPVLLQAASDAYFGSRPQVAEMVAQDAQALSAAAAAAPTRQEVRETVCQVLQQLEQLGGQQQEQRQRIAAVLREHVRELLRVECELQSSGGWQTLLPHMPSRSEAQKQGWRLHSSPVDSAVCSWLRVRKAMAATAAGSAML